MRLQKYLAGAGVCSRRKAEECIKEGLVRVNGVVVTQMGTVVDPKEDEIMFNDQVVRLQASFVYVMLHKPVGYVTTASDDMGRPTVMSLVADINERLFPVGRLDYDTSGLLLLTTDGDLAYRLTHPKHEIIKEYVATIKGIPNSAKLRQFAEGLLLKDGVTAPADISVVIRQGKNAVVRILIHEGKNRQVRRMCAAIGHPVLALKRVAIAGISLGDLKEGEYRHLNL